MFNHPMLTMAPFMIAVWGGAFLVAWRHPGCSEAVLQTMGTTGIPLVLWFWTHLERHVNTEEMEGKSETGN